MEWGLSGAMLAKRAEPKALARQQACFCGTACLQAVEESRQHGQQVDRATASNTSPVAQVSVLSIRYPVYCLLLRGRRLRQKDAKTRSRSPSRSFASWRLCVKVRSHASLVCALCSCTLVSQGNPTLRDGSWKPWLANRQWHPTTVAPGLPRIVSRRAKPGVGSMFSATDA